MRDDLKWDQDLFGDDDDGDLRHGLSSGDALSSLSASPPPASPEPNAMTPSYGDHNAALGTGIPSGF